MSHDSKIPLDPKENLSRLEGINGHLKKKLEHKQGLLLKKDDRIDGLKEALENTPTDTSEMDASALATAARQEQMLMSAESEADDLWSEVKELKGKLRWNEKQLERVSEQVEREGELTYTLAEKARQVQTEAE